MNRLIRTPYGPPNFLSTFYCKIVILSRFVALSVSLTPKASLLLQT